MSSFVLLYLICTLTAPLQVLSDKNADRLTSATYVALKNKLCRGLTNAIPISGEEKTKRYSDKNFSEGEPLTARERGKE